MKMRLVCRDIYRFINKRRQRIIFKDKDITEKVFFDLIAKASGYYNTSTCLKNKPPLICKNVSLK